MLTKKMVSGLMLGLLVLSGSAFAETSTGGSNLPPQGQRGDQGRANGPSRVPPEFAISVCKGKSEGTTCEMSGPSGTKTGTCVYTPDNKYFACRPNDMKMSAPPSQR